MQKKLDFLSASQCHIYLSAGFELRLILSLYNGGAGRYIAGLYVLPASTDICFTRILRVIRRDRKSQPYSISDPRARRVRLCKKQNHLIKTIYINICIYFILFYFIFRDKLKRSIVTHTKINMNLFEKLIIHVTM